MRPKGHKAEKFCAVSHPPKGGGKHARTFCQFVKAFGDKRPGGRKIARSAAAVLFWILVWHAAATLANRSLLLKIPLPLETLRAFLRLFREGRFWRGVASSILHILLGGLSAAVLGTAGGMASAASAWFRQLSAPLLRLIRTVPVAAFIMLAWLWIPSRVLPSFVSALMVLPIVWSHVDAGLASVDPLLPEMARAFGMGRLQILTKVRLPLMDPALRAGCLTGIGIAWKSGIAAEIICNPTGSIGALLQGAKTSIDYERVFAVTLMVVLLSILFEVVLRLVWKEQKR